MKTLFFVGIVCVILFFGNLIGPDLGLAFADGGICTSLSAQRDAISKNPLTLKAYCKSSFESALQCCLTPDTCSPGGVLGGFGGEAINDAAKNLAANGAMLAQAAGTAASECAKLRNTCYETCEAESKTINPSTEYALYQGHNTAMKYCGGVFREAGLCLEDVVAKASSVVSQATSVATQTAAATALTGAGALGGSGTGGSGSDGSYGDSSGEKVAATPSQIWGGTGPKAPCVTQGNSPRPCLQASISTSGSAVAVTTPSNSGDPRNGSNAPYVSPGPSGARSLSSATTGSGSTGLAAAPTTGGGRSPGSSGGMALTANPGGGGAGGSGSSQSGSSGSSVASSGGGANGSTGTGAGGGWGSNPRNGSPYGQGLGASPTTAGTTGSGVAASTTLASAGTNQGLPDNNCDLEEKVFTPACFDIMNDYCTTTQRQGSGCKSFCRTNSASTACAGSK
ncbi:MAG: hypothetical protein IPJ71_03760 [Bdellovibrionales bacterium]|nr:hypothetical protein [Bdellovibrionales bacterium]